MSDESSWEELETDEGSGPFYIGDQPTSALVQEVDPQDGFSAASAELVDPTGVQIASLDAVIEDDHVRVNWSQDPFEEPGVHRVLITLSGAGRRKRLDPIEIVVEDEASGWHTLASARSQWADAVQLSHAQLWTFLDAARAAVIAYAPRSTFEPAPLPQPIAAAGTWIPHPTLEGYEIQVDGPVSTTGYQQLFGAVPKPSASLRTAQLLHARALWNATSSDNNGTTADGFGGIVTVRPLDGTVKALIRPKRGIPGVA